MSRTRRTNKRSTVEASPIYHQQNPSPGLTACGVILDFKNEATLDRDKVNCPDCLSRPDPTPPEV